MYWNSSASPARLPSRVAAGGSARAISWLLVIRAQALNEWREGGNEWLRDLVFEAIYRSS